MRLISLDVLAPGMVIAKSIWNDAGRPLLQQGVVVSQTMINRLQQLNIKYVYIDDEISKGIEVEETVPVEKRLRTVKKITESFNKLKGLEGKKASYILDIQSQEIGNMIDGLLESILESKEMLTVLTDSYIYDEYLYQHSFQVTLYALAIAKELGYSYKEIKLIGIGAILHDVGKLQIPTNILFKPGKLTDEEYETVKNHAQFGFDILRNLHSISLLVAHCAYQHHERLDGSGYPRGIVEKDIHPYAKIIAVADVFDAVTSDRVYRNKLLPSQGIQLLESGSGVLFDTKVVEALKRSIVHYPNGTILLLSDGRRGVVAKQNLNNSELPQVRIFEENNAILKSTYMLNLEEHPEVCVEKVETQYIKQAE
ncbi:Putative nucleotidyltransferase with HDIG domain OS=Ureibacillus acetophenoni OX=614649 GN=SAMN05877842_109103 PE=4 SV=1 [Ureibacillus acetophenoni]